MDPAFVEAFTFSIENFFSTMILAPVEIAPPSVLNPADEHHDVSGIIGLSGEVTGSVVVSFPIATAEALVTRFAGTPIAHSDEDFTDAIGEVTNMIAGGAKSNFPHTAVSISCPSVVVGPGHKVFRRHDLPVVCFACNSELGKFGVQVTMKVNDQSDRAESDAQAA